MACQHWRFVVLVHKPDRPLNINFLVVRNVLLVMYISSLCQDAWTCWPLMATSPLWHLSHSWPVLLSSSLSPMRSSVWSCLMSLSTAVLETSSRFASIAKYKTCTNPLRQAEWKFKAFSLKPKILFHQTFDLKKKCQIGLRQYLRAYHTESMCWSHYLKQVWEEEGFGSEDKPASYVAVLGYVGQSGDKDGTGRNERCCNFKVLAAFGAWIKAVYKHTPCEWETHVQHVQQMNQASFFHLLFV